MFRLSERVRYNYRITDSIDIYDISTEEKSTISVFNAISMIDRGEIISHSYIVTKPYRGYQMVRFTKIKGEIHGKS